MSTEGLHAALLAAIGYEQGETQSWMGDVADALRAVVELHAPVPCGLPSCRNPQTHLICGQCGSGINAPCKEIQVIAEKLGVAAEGGH